MRTTHCSPPGAWALKRVCRRWAAAWLAVLCLGTGGVVHPSGASEKAVELERALESIQEMTRRISDRAAEAQSLHRILSGHAEELRAEITAERRRHSPASLPQALRVDRIRYDLQLMQHLSAHINGLDRRISQLDAALCTLEFLSRRVGDDRLLLQSLQDADIGGLIQQIRSELAAMTAAAEGPLLSASELRQPSMEGVWKDIAQR
jgi:chromosome segregation ATPase